jgi:hypothetical protein
MAKTVYVNPKYKDQVDSSGIKLKSSVASPHVQENIKQQYNQQQQSQKKKNKGNGAWSNYKPSHFIPDEVFFTDDNLDTSGVVQIKSDIGFVVIDGVTIIPSRVISIDADSRNVMVYLDGNVQHIFQTMNQVESDKIVSILHQLIRNQYSATPQKSKSSR